VILQEQHGKSVTSTTKTTEYLGYQDLAMNSKAVMVLLAMETYNGWKEAFLEESVTLIQGEVWSGILNLDPLLAVALIYQPLFSPVPQVQTPFPLPTS
jgi:hypothetical protein